MEEYKKPTESFSNRLRQLRKEAIEFLSHIYTAPEHEDHNTSRIGHVGRRFVPVRFTLLRPNSHPMHCGGIVFSADGDYVVWEHDARDGKYIPINGRDWNPRELRTDDLFKVADEVAGIEGLEMQMRFVPEI